MEADQNSRDAEVANGTKLQPGHGRLVLGIDTCGSVGSVALGRLHAEGIEILAQSELEGRTYSSTLISAIGDLLARAGVKLADLHAIVAVNGPGSFTGVRVGLSAVKGLAEPQQIPVVAVSRLEVLACKTGTDCAALDAHRQEVFLRLRDRELLAGTEELAGIDLPRFGDTPQIPKGQSHSEPSISTRTEQRLPRTEQTAEKTTPPVILKGPVTGHDLSHAANAPESTRTSTPARASLPINASGTSEAGIFPCHAIAVCDDAAAALLAAAWREARIIVTNPPTAADALALCAGRIEAKHFVDLELLDGHYLRRSDAEIFGDAQAAALAGTRGA